MLQKLYISNYAIIDEIAISFTGSLNIITGETGAGKSILMGALSLILGERAESNILLNKEKKCVVEGYFHIKNNTGIKAFLSANDLDSEEELVLRREIAINGKSRAFINDTPVNLNQLKEVSLLLVDLHQQFDTREIGDNNFQRAVLDAIAGNSELLIEYGKQFLRYKNFRNELEQLKQQQQETNAVLDYNKFLFQELEDAAFKENELEELDAELRLLSHSEEVKQQLNGIYFELKESETPLVQQLKLIAGKLNSLKQYHTLLGELGSRIESVQIELDDVAGTVDSINESIQYNPERVQVVNDKISLGYKLLKKHNVLTTVELLKIKDSLQEKLDAVLNISSLITAKEKETVALLQGCSEMAIKIAANRSKASKPFADRVNTLLKQVGMPNAGVKIQISPVDIDEYGTDGILFLFDANKTGHFEPLHKVASGGELSRLMLCIKSIVASKLQLPTLIFDEIDTGISGEAAKQVGILMKELSDSHQVMAITHQPQIAARATAHYFVFKNTLNGKISTSVRLLNAGERVNIIAQMLGGEKPSEAALQNAKEMIGGIAG
ncbi:MAG: DNA repair protein RecN [Chitinophagaceae bacterium]|nr:DNA repair protein RecN [Chitinophagaceae bacterium]